MLIHLVVLLLSLAGEAFYGAYVLCVNRRLLAGAVLCTVAINIFGGLITFLYVHDPAFIVTAAAGEAIGTACIVLYSSKIGGSKEAEMAEKVAALEEEVDEWKRLVLTVLEEAPEEEEEESQEPLT